MQGNREISGNRMHDVKMQKESIKGNIYIYIFNHICTYIGGVCAHEKRGLQRPDDGARVPRFGLTGSCQLMSSARSIYAFSH